MRFFRATTIYAFDHSETGSTPHTCIHIKRKKKPATSLLHLAVGRSNQRRRRHKDFWLFWPISRNVLCSLFAYRPDLRDLITKQDAKPSTRESAMGGWLFLNKEKDGIFNIPLLWEITDEYKSIRWSQCRWAIIQTTLILYLYILVNYIQSSHEQFTLDLTHTQTPCPSV